MKEFVYSLHTPGMQESDLERAADFACADPYWNPRPVERAAIRAMLQNAFEGNAPQEHHKKFKDECKRKPCCQLTCPIPA
jgi:hypothetical protein